MGVPGLFSFLNRRYPQITRPVEHKRGSTAPNNEQTDNLYIDMNHIVHSCTHALVAKDRPEVSRADMFAGMGTYLDSLLDLLEPRRVVMVAVDGVAPRAKMNQQRTRRFLSAYISGIRDRIERDIRREMRGEAGGDLHIPDLKPFDPNIITPGTDFMLALAQWLRDWAVERVTRDRRFAHTTFIISDASEPGEGEHKIMKFMRHLRTQPNYDPDTRHVVFGQDADLLLLTLLSHEPHVRIIREDMQANKPDVKAAREAELQDQQQQQRNPILLQQQLLLQQQPLSAVQAALMQQQQTAAPPPPNLIRSLQPGTAASDHLNMPMFEIVDIRLLRECIQWEFSDLVGPPGPPGTYGTDLDSADSDTADDQTDDDLLDSRKGGVECGGLDSSDSDVGTADRTPGINSCSDSEDQGVVTDAAGLATGPAAAAVNRATAGDVAAMTVATTQDGDTDLGSNRSPVQIAAALPAAGAASSLTAQGDPDTKNCGDDSDDSLEDLLSVLNTASTDIDPAVQQPTQLTPSPAVATAEEPNSSSSSVSQGIDSSSSSSSGGSSVVVEQGRLETPIAADPADSAVSDAASLPHRSKLTAAPAQSLLGSTLCLPLATGTALADGVHAVHDTAAGGAADASSASSSSSTRQVLQGSLGAPTAAHFNCTLAAPAVAEQINASSNAVLGGSTAHLNSSIGPPAIAAQASVSDRAADGAAKEGRSATGSVTSTAAAAGGGGGAAARVAKAPRPRHRGKAGLTFENLLDDIVVLTFLVGNDFLPLIPSLDIYDRPTGLDLLFTSYKQLLPSMGGHISAGGAINRSRLVQLLVYLQRDEEAAYKRRADYRRRRSYQRSVQQAAVQAEVDALFDGGLSMGEVPAGVDLDKLLAGINPAAAEEQQYWNDVAAVNLWNMTPGQLCEELSNRVSSRLDDRVMGGDPWAQDPIQMDMPKYRDRYYQARFPELFQQLSGDVDQVAATVSWEYLQGMQWVLRYYTAGPAAIRWQQQQQQQEVNPQINPELGPGLDGQRNENGQQQQSEQQEQEQQLEEGKEQDTRGGGGTPGRERTNTRRKKKGLVPAAAADVEGASWSWCYPYHYAPLMQDLVKVKLWRKSAGGKTAVTAGPVHLKRQLLNPESCPIADWAPVGGPVRPLLQLMCVLPAKSVADALPAELANIMAIAETMEDGTAIAANSQQQNHPQHLPGGDRLPKQGGGKALQLERFQPPVEVTLSQQSRFHGLDQLDVDSKTTSYSQLEGGTPTSGHSNARSDTDSHCDEASYESAAANGQQLSSSESSSSSSSSSPEQQGSHSLSQILGFESSGNSDQDLIRLAELLCTTFPSNIDSLVDLTGKKYIHTGVVRLPMVDPQLIAAVLQAVLSMQQQDSSSSSIGRKVLSEGEIQGNSFRPATVIAAAAAAVAGDPAAATSTLRSSSKDSDGSSAIWQSLARTHGDGGTATQQQQSSLRGASSSSTSTSRSSAVAATVTAAAASSRLGALGMLLGQRGALHTLPKATLQHLPTPSSQQQQQEVTVQQQDLDIAGLPVPEHECYLLSGVDLSDLKVTPAVWRHMAAGFTTATNHAERVLGIRSSSNYSSGSNGGSASSANMNSGRGALGRGGRGRRGGRGGRSFWGEIAM